MQSVARRYARALYEEAERRSATSSIDADVELIHRSMEGSRELVSFFRSPIISRDKKKAVTRELFAGRVHELTAQFLALLIEKDREELFPDLVRAYRDLRDRQLGIVEARARVARSLSEDEEKNLQAALERMTGRRIRLSVELEESMIGGLIVRVGDTVYDGSVRHQLELLRERMEVGSYIMN